MCLIDGPLFLSKVSSKCPATMFAVKRIASVPGRIILLMASMITINGINPLNPELNPICYLLALLRAHHFLHVSRIRVKLLILMSYIYIYMEHPFLMFLITHNDAAQSVELLWTSDQLVAETST